MFKKGLVKNKMRKKSHISLSLYLINNIDSELLETHKKAFIVGSILPDCKPSFVTIRHNIEETFEMVTEFIKKLTTDYENFKRISTAYCRKLGEVTHYIADYFTFPHNDEFDGNIKDHCMYEKHLKYALKEYINSEDICVNKDIARNFKTPDELCSFVKNLHKQYLSNKNDIASDCRYIVALCHIVVTGILHLLELSREKAVALEPAAV